MPNALNTYISNSEKQLRRLAALLLAIFYVLAINLSLLSNTAFAADPQYTLVYPSGKRAASDLVAASNDGGIGDDDVNGILSQTYMLTRGGPLGTARLSLDKEKSNKNDLPTYKLEYYCLPKQNYKFTTTRPSGDKPYVRYTLGIALFDNNDWGGMTKENSYRTYVGLVGNTYVGTAHLPEIVNPNTGTVPESDWDVKAEGGDNDIRQNPVKYLGPFEPDGGETNFFSRYGNFPTDGEVLSKCFYSPRGYVANATNFRKLENSDKQKWNKAVRDAGIGEDSDSAGGGADADPDGGGSGIECKNGGLSLGFALCSLAEFGQNFTEKAFTELIQPLLEDVPVTLDPEEPSFKAWQSFRFLANIVLVSAMLAIVYAQARGGE